MKKSEALSKLLKRLETIKGCDPDTGEIIYPNDEYLVYALLDEMEKMVMLPPCNIGWNCHDCQDHSWDKE